MLAAYLDSAMHHAVTSREKCEVYLRLAAYNGIRRDSTAFSAYHSLYKAACLDTLKDSRLLSPRIIPTTTKKIATLVAAMDGIFSGDMANARHIVNGVSDNYTRHALNYLIARFNRDRWLALTYRDSIMTDNRYRNRGIDSLDRIWIERYLGNDSLRQTIMRRQRETNAMLIRQQQRKKTSSQWNSQSQGHLRRAWKTCCQPQPSP